MPRRARVRARASARALPFALLCICTFAHADGAAITGNDPSSSKSAAPQPIGNTPELSSTPDGFTFGSYGRVGIGIDGGLHEGYATNVVAHGSRLEESPYMEVYLAYTGRLPGGPRWRVMLTPAFTGELFHYSGDFSSRFAIRQAYAEVADLLPGLNLWVGSRMYRGDDVYLLDWWPLDNLNTVGGGATWHKGGLYLALHVGENRLDDPWQYETLPEPAHGLGPSVPALVLDRPRVVGSFKASYTLQPPRSHFGARAAVYAEVHGVGEGTYQYQSEMRSQKLPSETGFLVGAELSVWRGGNGFANLFFKYATGIAAYGELNPPAAVDTSGSAQNARDVTLALSADLESRFAGMLVAAYVRAFRSGDPVPFDPQSYGEGILDVRPQVYLTRYIHLAVELSYQARQYDGFDPYLNRRLEPKVFRASLMPIVSPTGKGAYSRPIIYAVATLSELNADARDALFDPNDIRYGKSTVWYFGLGAEWWFQNLGGL